MACCARRRARHLSTAAIAIAVALAGCARKEEVLPGERYELRDLAAASEVLETTVDVASTVEGPQPPREIPLASYIVEGEAARISLGTQRAVGAWPQSGQNAGHLAPHAQLRTGALTKVWSTSVGLGNERRQRLTAAPVAAQGRVFTMDSASTVSALGRDGQLLWQSNVTPPGERAGEVVGGGLAVIGSTLFVTTGWGKLHALDAGSGKSLWEQDFGAPVSGPPMVNGSLVYVVSRDGFASALDIKTGRITWQIEGSRVPASVSGSGVPALAGGTVIFPFDDGELSAVLGQAGVNLWSSSVSGSRVGRSLGAIGGVTGGPVVSGDTLFVGTQAGRLAALDADTGGRLWTTLEGASGQLAVAGGSVFLMSDEARLLRVNARDGSIIWAATLPLFETEKVRRRKDVFVHYGPILAGGRLILVSTDGLMREVDPASGQLLRSTEIGAPAAVPPIVVDQTLYVITADGQLHAFR